MGRVEGKVALVTGAASGLGLADAQRLAEEGASVVLTDINDAGREAAERIAADTGARTLFLHLDVTDPARWKEVVAETEAQHLQVQTFHHTQTPNITITIIIIIIARLIIPPFDALMDLRNGPIKVNSNIALHKPSPTPPMLFPLHSIYIDHLWIK